MDSKLFFISNNSAVEMSEQKYEREDYLQKLVEENPHLLARAWGGYECRLFLVKREFIIAKSEDGTESFFLDHLLIGEDAVPVLVEVKRSSDTRIKREVVAQMIDYACRASTWDATEMRRFFAENNDEETVAAFDNDEFWNQVQTNLRAEHLRLVFVADKIPDSLRVMVEFLDRNLNGIEVYCVELRPYATNGAFLLASSIIGNSLLEKQQQAQRSFKSWNDEAFIEYLEERGEGELAQIAFDIRDFAGSIGLSCAYGKSANSPSFSMRIGNCTLFTISGWFKKSAGHICTADFAVSWRVQNLGGAWTEDQLLDLITDLPGKDAAKAAGYIWETPKFLYIDLRSLTDRSNLEAFKHNIEAFANAMRQAIE